MTAFLKMNGLGNDFVVVDARVAPFAPDPAAVQSLADRGAGIGFDQLIVIEPPRRRDEAAFMRILNADGGEVEACGNATRCVAALLLAETGAAEIAVGSAGGPLRAWGEAGGRIAVDMGVARFDAAAIPLAPGAGDPLALRFEGDLAAFGPAACANVGNPHAVFFVADADAVPLETVGPRFERHPAFPERANISFVTVETPGRVRARVFERGVGPTLACGTAACAIAAVGHRTGRLGETVDVALPGGTLGIALAGGRIVMSGPWQLDWRGTLDGTTFSRAA